MNFFLDSPYFFQLIKHHSINLFSFQPPSAKACLQGLERGVQDQQHPPHTPPPAAAARVRSVGPHPNEGLGGAEWKSRQSDVEEEEEEEEEERENGRGKQLLPSQFPVQLLSAHTHTGVWLCCCCCCCCWCWWWWRSTSTRTTKGRTVRGVWGGELTASQDRITTPSATSSLNSLFCFFFLLHIYRDPNHQSVWR